MEIFDTAGQVFTCGGTIIDANYILSAAHCFYEPMKFFPFKYKDYSFDVTVKMGITSDLDPDFIKRTVRKENIFMHENYRTLNQVCCRFCHPKEASKLCLSFAYPALPILFKYRALGPDAQIAPPCEVNP